MLRSVMYGWAKDIWKMVETELPDIDNILSYAEDFNDMYESGEEFSQVKFYYRTPELMVVDRQLISMTHEDANYIVELMQEFNDKLVLATEDYMLNNVSEYDRRTFYSSFRPELDIGFCYIDRYVRVLGD